jgi:hypothetical protein
VKHKVEPCDRTLGSNAEGVFDFIKKQSLPYRGGTDMKIIYKDGHVAECPAEEELHVLRHSVYPRAVLLASLRGDRRGGYGPC